MKIAYIHQYFKTPEQGGGIRSFHLAKTLADAGHEVTMITSHNGPEEIKEIAGIQVNYLPVRYSNSMDAWQRIWAFLKFVRLGKRLLRKLHQSKSFDLAYVMTTPLTTGMIAIYGKKKLGIPYYFEVGDLWPEAPIQMGVVRNPMLKSVLRRFEEKCYKESKKVIALSPDIKSSIQNNISAEKVEVIPNMSDCNFFQPEIRKNPISKEYPLRVGYFGTFGAANDLHSFIPFIEATADLQIKYIFMGDGTYFESFKESTAHLSQVEVIAGAGMDQVKQQMAKTDVILVHFKNVPVLSTGSPNKFFDGLAAGKLIITNFEGWIGQLIDQQPCGFSFDPNGTEDFKRKIRPFIDDQSLLETYQKNARQLASRYSVETLSKPFTNLFDR